MTGTEPQQSPITQEGTIVGTFQYMSPEQIEDKEVDGRSDIFSLGTVLYETVTAQRAFPGKSQLSVASAILEKEPAPITGIKPLTLPPSSTQFAAASPDLRTTAKRRRHGWDSDGRGNPRKSFEHHDGKRPPIVPFTVRP
jgi:serine/threonine protein kinase